MPSLSHDSFILCLSIAWDCNARITSSRDSFTFCPGDNVTLTCSQSASVHVWQISSSAATFILIPNVARTTSTADGSIIFAIVSTEGGTINSTMAFTASVGVISNGTVVSCSNSTAEPRMTFSETVDIFGEKKVTQC